MARSEQIGSVHLDSALEMAVSKLAEGQFGVVSRGASSLALGILGEVRLMRLRSGRLYRLYPGVYAVGHGMFRGEGRWLAAVLARVVRTRSSVIDRLRRSGGYGSGSRGADRDVGVAESSSAALDPAALPCCLDEVSARSGFRSPPSRGRSSISPRSRRRLVERAAPGVRIPAPTSPTPIGSARSISRPVRTARSGAPRAPRAERPPGRSSERARDPVRAVLLAGGLPRAPPQRLDRGVRGHWSRPTAFGR